MELYSFVFVCFSSNPDAPSLVDTGYEYSRNGFSSMGWGGGGGYYGGRGGGYYAVAAPKSGAGKKVLNGNSFMR